MIRRALHRAAVAIVLMATVLAPYGSCRAQIRAAAHDCCPRAASHAPLVKQDCCVTRASFPAMITERAASNPTPLLPLHSFVAVTGLRAPADLVAAMPAIAFSPPPGTSVLRI